MATIRKIVTSKIDGDSSNNTTTNEIRPYGELAVYVGDNDKLELLMFDGVRTHVRSKVLNKGTFYGGDADSADGAGYDSIKLVPDEELRRSGSQQYIIVEPTGGEPGHVHIRAGGTIDSSTADLFLGGELNNVRVSDTSNSVTISADANDNGATRSWIFDTNGILSVPAINNENLFIQGAEIGSTTSGIGITATNGITLTTDALGTAKFWQFGTDGSLTIPRDIKSDQEINIDINLSDSTLRRWRFGEDGDLRLPGALTTNGYIKALGPTDGDGNGDNLTVQAGETVTGDGGDLTVHAGDTVTGVGGDLTVRSGVAVTGNAGVLNVRASDTVTGDGGMLNIRAGDAVTGDAGDIDIRAGDTITGDGGSITITAGSTVNSGPGGSVTITSGSNTNGAAGDIDLVAATSSSGADGVINLTTAVGSWTFGATGNLTFPIGLTIENFSGTPMIRSDNGTAAVLGGASATTGEGIIIQAGNGGADDGVDPMTGGSGGGMIIAGGTGTGDFAGGSIQIFGGFDANGNFAEVTIGNGAGQFHFYGNGTLEFPDSTVQSTAWTGTLTVNDSGLTINGGTGTIYQGPSGVLQVGDKKGGVYHAASTSSNGLFTFGMNGGGIMSAAVEGSLFVGNNLPSNNGGVTTAYGGWLVVENGGKFGTDVDTLGNVSIGKGVFEKFQAKQDATGTVEHDCLNGHIFYHTSPDANWTANFTNLNIATSYATSVTVVIAQGGTGYYPNAVQIGGVAQTINWQGNVNPTPSTNRTDVVTFSILNNSGTYTVLGQLTGF
jgi:hypothetical protein